MSLRRLACLMWAIALGLPCPGYSAESLADCPIQLLDATAASRIAFRHTDGGSGKRYIVESVVAGLATFDYDGDGWIDIYFLNGAPLRGTVAQVPPRDALYRNNRDGTFTDVTDLAGVGDLGYGLGVTVADYDNDGDSDLYISNFGPNVLYSNNGDGTFTDVTAAAGVARGERVGAGVCFLDIEGDGDLDLYAANYVDFNYDNHVTRMIGPHAFHAGPADYRPVPDNLYRNNGDGTFTDISVSSGIGSAAGAGMGVVCFDCDDDGDSDIFVCNDQSANFLFQNDGNGHFEEIGLLAGVAYDINGNANGSMGADCGDFDGDGWLDLFMTDYQDEFPVLYRNRGDGSFDDVTRATGAGAGTFPHVTWGVGFVDFDHDGDRDVFIACGHFMDNIHHIDDRTAVRVPNVLLMNTGSGKFLDVSATSGDGLAVVESSHGAAFDDLDNDGDIDAVIMNTNTLPTVLRNESRGGPYWLQLRLCGRTANRDGVGARVRVVAGELVQVAEVHSGRGYQSHYGTRLHFGLRSHVARRPHRGSLGGGRSRRVDQRGSQPPGPASRGKLRLGFGPLNGCISDASECLLPERGRMRIDSNNATVNKRGCGFVHHAVTPDYDLRFATRNLQALAILLARHLSPRLPPLQWERDR